MFLDVSLYIIYKEKKVILLQENSEVTTLSFDTVKENLPPDEK